MTKGLFIDYAWCTGCHSCEMACKAEKNLPKGQWGIKLQQNGPWQLTEDKWDYTFLPVPTELCDLCAERVEEGRLPSCVHHCQALCMEYGEVEDLAKKLTSAKTVLFVPCV